MKTFGEFWENVNKYFYNTLESPRKFWKLKENNFKKLSKTRKIWKIFKKFWENIGKFLKDHRTIGRIFVNSEKVLDNFNKMYGNFQKILSEIVGKFFGR